MRVRQATYLTVVVGCMCLLIGCSLRDGDWMGPMERSLRTLLNGWDMWETPGVTPYEAPLVTPVPGTFSCSQLADRGIQCSGKSRYERARQQYLALPFLQQRQRSQLTYRRYCHHCHGPSGDGHIIVGESFGLRLPDLRSSEVQHKSDRELFLQLVRGSDERGGPCGRGVCRMISLADTLSPLELILAIRHVRKLRDALPQPFFSPKSVSPLPRR